MNELGHVDTRKCISVFPSNMIFSEAQNREDAGGGEQTVTFNINSETFSLKGNDRRVNGLNWERLQFPVSTPVSRPWVGIRWMLWKSFEVGI